MKYEAYRDVADDAERVFHQQNLRGREEACEGQES